MSPRPVRLIVCGERQRGDDAAALCALDQIPAEVLVAADVRVGGGLDAGDLLDVPEGTWCVVADAVSGVRPGEVVVVKLAELADPAGPEAGPRPWSTHVLDPRAVLELVAQLRGSVPDGTFVGMGAADFTFGAPLSEPVRTGLPAFADTLAAAIGGGA